ncbi:MAG: methyltransferase domain-containing protein, partial [Chloroflexi bacterium]|nr:methyltransferase domain-containing protein [Chloroflexota bacterium]
MLVSRKKLSATVGDSSDMLQARRQFLDGGFYQPLADSIAELVAAFAIDYANSKGGVNLLDAGCGEGYYTNQVQNACQNQLLIQPFCFYGADIAKTAVRMAAKRVKNGRFIVSDVNKKLPFPDQSIDVLLNIFAPRNVNEFARLLSPQGMLLVVIPEPHHLQSLRSQFKLLSIEPNKESHIIEQLGASFSLCESTGLTFPMALVGTAVHNLIHMTPSARHLNEVQKTAVATAKPIETEAAF